MKVCSRCKKHGNLRKTWYNNYYHFFCCKCRHELNITEKSDRHRYKYEAW